jgi:hypothetical protein
VHHAQTYTRKKSEKRGDNQENRSQDPPHHGKACGGKMPGMKDPRNRAMAASVIPLARDAPLKV